MIQKQIKYSLILVVSLIWGLILYRVVKGIMDDDPVSALAVSPKHIDYNHPAEDFTLMTNYPDPFIIEDKTSQPDELVISSNKISQVISPAPKPVFDPSVIQYNGMISNPEKKIKVAILNISGKEYMVKEKEKVNDYLIRSISKNNVIVIYKGSIYTIDKKN